ncbi:hypothetical protein Trydic_g3199 [Trypoxylus dichotomus]
MRQEKLSDNRPPIHLGSFTEMMSSSENFPRGKGRRIVDGPPLPLGWVHHRRRKIKCTLDAESFMNFVKSRGGHTGRAGRPRLCKKCRALGFLTP